MNMKISLLLGLCALGASAVMADNFVTTGATVTTDGSAEIYTWADTNTVGTIVVPEGGALFDVLLVGGGGAGGFCRGGGGGGGGVVYQTGLSLAAGTYYIKIGAGGVPDYWANQSYGAPASTAATDGQPTTISNATEQLRIAYGGGGGATFKSGVSRAGASSGGCSNCNTVAPEGIAGQGNQGGATHVSNNYYSGGGGGAGAAGENGTNAKSGSGGAGYACSISGTSVYYGAGGGGGVCGGSTTTSGAGGTGGGGHGGSGQNTDVTAGADGVGAGGGGGAGSANNAAYCGGKNGGSGVVILRTVTEALGPSCTDIQVSVNGTNVTFSSTLVGTGTDSSARSGATSCDLYLAYGTDPDNLVPVKVKTGWTLDGAAWSMTVSDIASYTKFYWRAALTNDLGFGADAEQSGFNLNQGTGAALPLKYGFSDSSMELFVSGMINIGEYDLPALVDGLTTRGCNLNRSISPNVLFDAGEEKHVKMLRSYCSQTGAVLTNTVKELSLYGSNDRETWTKLADTNDFVFGVVSNSWMEAPLPASAGYRYFELRGVLDVRLQELQLISEEMSLKLDKPTYYLTSSTVEDLAAEYDPDGVTISGTLVNSPSSATEICGYYAATDYDADESAWIANGTKFTISGTYATGDTFSQKVLMSGRGRNYVRLFARAGSVSTSSQRSWEVALKTKAKVVPAYLTWSSFYKIYDGDVSSNLDDGYASYIIFDLRGLGKNETLSHLRMWPVNGYNQFVWTRMRCGKIYVSYDDATVATNGTTLVDGREVYQIDSEPSVNWTLIKPYLDDVVNIHSGTECVYTGLPTNARPTFLKIGNFVRENCREIELRVVESAKGLIMFVR